jgi:hypothetical protein
MDQGFRHQTTVAGLFPAEPYGLFPGGLSPRALRFQRQWCSGNIAAFQAVALGSIPGWRKLIYFFYIYYHEYNCI